MADNDVVWKDQNTTPMTFSPRTKDRGGIVRESVVGVSNSSGTQIDPMPSSGGKLSLAASTSDGTSTYAAVGGTGNALLTATPIAVKSSPGNLYGVSFVNTGVADTYVQVFNVAAGSVTLGTTAPKTVFWVPAGGSWEEKFTGEAKITFDTAMTAAATTTPTGSTAPSTGIIATFIYK